MKNNPAQPYRHEKASIGGAFNSGVTSSDDKVREQIEKQGSMYKGQPGSHAQECSPGKSFSTHKIKIMAAGLLLITAATAAFLVIANKSKS